jgi:hypothetical protein
VAEGREAMSASVWCMHLTGGHTMAHVDHTQKVSSAHRGVCNIR